MARPSRFSPEVRERAVRMVFEHAQDHASQWAAITSIAEKIGCAAETLQSWMRQAERNGGRRPGLTTDARARFKHTVDHRDLPTRFVRPRRIHPRRVLALVREGQEREFHSSTIRALLSRPQ